LQTKNLEDRLSIRELAYTYARMVDDRNYPLADEIFTQDAELIGPGFHLRGRDEVRASVPSIEHYRATLHNVYNQLFEIRGNEAEGETYCVANHLHEVDGKPYKLDWGIRYRDHCRREADGWRFSRRELFVVWEQDLPLKEPRQPAAR
jgi:hypothetical protein